MPPWSATETIDWLLRRGRHLSDPQQLLTALCDRLVVAGLPLARVMAFLQTLHPQYFGFALRWAEGSTDIIFGEHGQIVSEAVQHSPALTIQRGERVIRRRLCDPGCPLDYAVLHELAAEGFTDYVIVELVFGTGTRNAVSLATRAAGGFSDHDVDEVQRLLHLFALIMENYTNRQIASNLLDAYLGTISGARVLDGQIRRGDHETIDAVIWFSDLRESTRLAEHLAPRDFLDLLNDYFEATAGAVLEHSGEVLRFIGDASLAVFPISGSTAGAREVCESAIAAARNAGVRAIACNAERRRGSKHTFSYGIALHVGHVIYGNIGTPNRLEFSVIGRAANETARIEGLTKDTGDLVLLSDSMVETCLGPGGARGGGPGAGFPSRGVHELRGVSRPIEVFGLATPPALP